MMKRYAKVKILYEWAQKLKGFVENNEYEVQKSNLLKEYPIDDLEELKEVFKEEYCFPAKDTKEIAENELDFHESKFTLLRLLRYIHDNMEKLKKNNIINIILMLSDIALYKAYSLLEEVSYGGLYFQLNICIILDAMKIKPDNNIDLSSILQEVSNKAKINIDMFDVSIIWTIAMLNYKMHVYDIAILFFESFLKSVEKENNSVINVKKINAKIYMGYCHEKINTLENFVEAIKIFEELLVELENKEDRKNIIIELYHGLGHFYNEKAIFGKAETKEEDILKARKYMKMALEQKEDYSSCYGSLYHEYGDYENAELIFEESAEKKNIKNNEELAKEMQFYIGQTCTAKVEEQSEQIKEAEKNFKEFEDYCTRTFNKDGVVHARIFKIRTKLRHIDFTATLANRKENRKKIEEWYEELKKDELSNYASRAIKNEYWKTLCILNIFRVLYVDDNFIWHKEDILFYLKNFIDLMPSDQFRLEYINNEKELNSDAGNLYEMCLDGLWIWCVGGKTLKEMVEKEEQQAIFRVNGIEKVEIIPVKDTEEAHRCINGNGKPDLVVLIPPKERDMGFEHEVKTIIRSVSESYFLYSKESSETYDINWLEEITQGIPQRNYADIISNIIPLAYCFRALEILRKEILEPIPLFSLAPTHFSSSYDFQLGENLEIQIDVLGKAGADAGYMKIRKLLEFVDKKYSSNLLRRHLVNMATDSLKEVCYKEEGFLIACFPQPEKITGQDNNYISYLVRDSSLFKDGMFAHGIKCGEIYTVKALTSYKKIYWRLETLISECAKECEVNDKHLCLNIPLQDNSEISAYCRNLLTVNLGVGFCDLSCQCRCILRKVMEEGKEKSFIYMILQKTEKSCTVSQDDGKEGIQMNPTVFVTYSWERTDKEQETLDYLREVKEFVNELRDNGYDATFDHELYNNNHNWTEIMIEGLQKDKIIVLLSKEYKRKADDWRKRGGVAFERNELVARFNRDKENIILAKLPSQKQYSKDELLPICFAGENIIDLSCTTPVIAGYDLLFSTLSNSSIVGKMHKVAKNINKGKII